MEKGKPDIRGFDLTIKPGEDVPMVGDMLRGHFGATDEDAECVVTSIQHIEWMMNGSLRWSGRVRVERIF